MDGCTGSQQGAIKVTKRKKHKGELLLRFSSFWDFCDAFQKLNAEMMIEMLAYRSVSIVKLALAGNVITRVGANICEDFFRSSFCCR
jgi:hypothetical protein